MTSHPLRSRSFVATAIVVAILLIDQVIKWAVKTHMRLGEHIDVTSWFQIHYVENGGMAFGMSFVSTFILALFRVAAIVLFAYVLVNIIRKQAPYGLLVCWACIVAGASGNLIDNCFYDLIYTRPALQEVGGICLPEISRLAGPGEANGTFFTGSVVDMFYFPLFTWPESWPLIGGDVFFGAIFNFADAAISCGVVALVLFYSKRLSGDYLLRRHSLPCNDKEEGRS